MGKEIEVKIQTSENDLKKLKTWLKKNSKFIAVQNQIDYYLNNPKNTLGGSNGQRKNY